MDTKSKKSNSRKPLRIWLCFFIGINILVFFALLGIITLDNRSSQDIIVIWPYSKDFKDLQIFKNNIASKFGFLARSITDNILNHQDIDEGFWQVDDEGENLIYYARNPETGKVITNSKNDLGISKGGLPSLPEGYDYYLYFDGNRFLAEKGGKPLDIYRNDSGYGFTVLGGYMNLEALPKEKEAKESTFRPKTTLHMDEKDYYGEDANTLIRAIEATHGIELSEEERSRLLEEIVARGDHTKELLMIAAGELNYRDYGPDIRGCQILLIVKEEIVENPYAGSVLYGLKGQTEFLKGVNYAGFGLLALTAILLIISIIKRREKREFSLKIANVLGKVFFEVKAIISLIVVIWLFYIFDYRWRYYNPASVIFVALVCLWWIYFMWVDLRANGGRFFSNNIINWGIKKYRKLEEKKPFQKGLLLRAYSIIAIETILMVLTGIFLLVMVRAREQSFIIFILIFMVIGTYLLYRYMKGYSSIIHDIGKVVDHTELIKKGDMTTKLHLDSHSDLHILEKNLNCIQEGVSIAAEERIKSERMKVELITNISHDLKTPLTSIISYADLLSKEEGLPEHVNDYTKILVQKSDRLKTLIQDLFDLSKAVSGDMDFERETLDLGKLIEQTLADLDEEIVGSQLAFRVNIPDKPVYIASDGKKLYRVLLNLISNTLKYSLLGSRVYVDLVVDKDKAIATIKNTSKYEMDFSKEEILERFVRGDKARSSEGSGLGLAIAQSFTQACGGGFDIKVDGDLFKVELSFGLEG